LKTKDGTIALVEYDLQFHKRIVDCHEDPDVFSIWKPIMIQMLMHYDRHTNLMDSYHEHKATVDAIRDGNKEIAIQVLHSNI
jgi:DNA-binding GntR family transcriptional regulator